MQRGEEINVTRPFLQRKITELPFCSHFWQHRDGFIRGQKGTLLFPSMSLLNTACALLGAGCRHISAVHLLPLTQAGGSSPHAKRLSVIIAKIHIGRPAIPSHPSHSTEGWGVLDKNPKEQPQASSGTSRLCSLNLQKTRKKPQHPMEKQRVYEAPLSTWQVTVRKFLC